MTPRQAQILALAANGLSDKQIARRLGVTHRTVRTHFEKLFHDRGIRNRSQAIALWSARNAEGHHSRPADECPYPKPFPLGFADCPAYQATQMVTLDLSHRPLGSVMTCR
ncbi:MAG: helix-turn-helix transcriptional regulator, partial [Chloroflexi bacterium]